MRQLQKEFEGTLDGIGCFGDNLWAAGDMFQRQIDEIFREMPNIFGSADDILMTAYNSNGADYDRILKKGKCCLIMFIPNVMY